ncbi:unnamed protein product, partial [Allacma fusca]
MERPNYKKRSTLPSIIKLLYLTGLLSTLLTCIFLWYSRTDPRPSNSNFLVAIPQEVLHLPRVTSSLHVGREPREDFLIRPGPPPQSTNHGSSISSLEIDFDDSFNDYISPSQNIVQSNLSSKDKGKNQSASEVGLFMERKLNLPTSPLMDFEDPGHDIFTSAQKKPTRSSFGQVTTSSISLITKALHSSVEFKSRDSMQERLDRVTHYCSAVSTEGKSYLQNVMLLLDQRTNKWIQVSKVVRKKEGDRILNKKVTLQWCPVFKAASTPWMAVMMKLKNYLTPDMEQLIRSGKVTFVKLAKLFHMNVKKPLPYSVTTKSSEMIMKTENPLLSMLVVRHPFERLLSAYRDKL